MTEQLIKNLKILKADKDLTNNDLADIFGVSLAVVKNYMRGKTPIPLEQLQALSSKKEVDIDWLLHGGTIQINEPKQIIRKGQAGRSVASNHRVHLRTLLAAIVDDLPEDIYDVFEVEGASMETTLSQGDKLLCRKDTVDNIQDNRVYVLVTDDPDIKEFRPSGVWIKRCNHRKANNYISCRSDNKDTTEPYNTFRLKCNTIIEVWYPVMKITPHMADPNRDIYNRLDELESRIEMLEDLNQ